MAKSIDVACYMLEESIKRSLEDENYLMDFTKLHKLLYLSYCYSKYKNNIDLFKETIIARNDGPYITNLNDIPAFLGFSYIKDVKKIKDKIMIFPISPSKRQTCKEILDTYGAYSKEELEKLTKETEAFKKFYIKNCDNAIDNETTIIETGKVIDKEINKIKNKKNIEYKVHKLKK